MIRSISDPAAIGQSFNIAHDRPVTQLELVNALAKSCKKKPNIARVPRDRIIEAGGNPMGEPLYFGAYFDLPPITEAVGKIKRVLKLPLTTFEQGLTETYAWYLRHHKPADANNDFEDQLIAQAVAPAS